MRATWLTGRALGLHALAVVVVLGCLIAARWQLHSALGGNGLSWAYTVEWPIFAGIAVVAWWHLIHEDPEARAARSDRAAVAAERQRLAELSDAGGRSWQEAAADAADLGDLTSRAERIRQAAAEELQDHLDRLAARDAESPWARTGRR